MKWGGADIEDSGVGLSGGPFDTSLLVEGVDAAKASPKRTAGVVGRGLVFKIGDQLMANGPPLLAGRHAALVRHDMGESSSQGGGGQ